MLFIQTFARVSYINTSHIQYCTEPPDKHHQPDRCTIVWNNSVEIVENYKTIKKKRGERAHSYPRLWALLLSSFSFSSSWQRIFETHKCAFACSTLMCVNYIFIKWIWVNSKAACGIKLPKKRTHKPSERKPIHTEEASVAIGG